MKKEHLRLPDYLHHIIQAIERVNAYIKGIEKEDWLKNTLIQDAVIRNIEIIGEASHNVQTLHQAFAKTNADFPWDDAYWMRNVLWKSGRSFTSGNDGNHAIRHLPFRD